MSDEKPTYFDELVMYYVARAAIPGGGGIGDGFKVFADPVRLARAKEQATIDANAVIDKILAAPGNKFGEDREAVAEKIIETVRERRGKTLSPSRGGANG